MPAGTRPQESPGGRRTRAVGGSGAPGPQEELGRPEGRTPGSPAPSAALSAGGPGPPGRKRSRKAERGPTRAPAAWCPPGPYLSRTAPAPARHCAPLPPRRSSMALAAAPRPARPDQSSGDAPAPGQPSAESSSRRPLAPAAAPAGLQAPAGLADAAGAEAREPPWTRPLLQGGETESQERAGAQKRLAQTILEPRILPPTTPCLPSGPPTVDSPLSSRRGLLKRNSDHATSLLKTAALLLLNPNPPHYRANTKIPLDLVHSYFCHSPRGLSAPASFRSCPRPFICHPLGLGCSSSRTVLTTGRKRKPHSDFKFTSWYI